MQLQSCVRRFCFLNLPHQPLSKPLFLPSVCVFLFFGLAFLALVGYCSAVPLQLGAESDRAPSPAPVPCVCHLSIHNISRFFPSPMQAVRTPPQQNHLGGPVLDGRGAFSFWSVALHTCTIVFVCLSFMPPHLVPCSLTPHFCFLLSRTQRSLF
jgi:hypothetical protein